MSAIPKDAREVYCDEFGKPIAFCPKESIGMVDILRAQFFQLNRERLTELRKRAHAKEMSTDIDWCVVCIAVDDPPWRPLVDSLMPGYDWQQFRDRGEAPVARGVVPRESIEAIARQAYPAVDGFREDEIPIVVFAAGGVSVFSIEQS